MSNKNFVNFHILMSHSPSCLNRDDMGMQKTAVFGGTRRVRISSQSLKRAMRTSGYYSEHLGMPSIRTREIGDFRNALAQKLGDKFPIELIEKAISFWSDARNLNDFDNSKTAVAPWLESEIEFLIAELQSNDKLTDICEKFLAITGNGDADKKKKKKQVDDAIKLLQKEGRWEALLQAGSTGMDIALSGRMATSGLMSNIDASLAVAHVITTHTVDGDLDWFTAVDDLQKQGSGHLDTQEFSAGVFYRYASLNLKQLQVNLGLIPNIKAEETAESRTEALRIATHVLHLLATIIPDAKRNSTAADNPADFVYVALSDQPISLANAFEEPVKSKNGFLKPSIKQFVDYNDTFYKKYDELVDRVAFFSLHDAEVKKLQGINCEKFSSLKNWLKKDGEI